MGQVFRVTDEARGTELALKLLPKGATPKAAALFELEYQTLAGFQYPRIVQVFDFGRDPRGAYYTMALLRGEELRGRAPISFREACGYLRDAAQALGLLHVRGLVHRDVSPRNLWRTPDGRVTLIDFGSLAAFGPSDHIVGTPPFVPPEALYGRELDQRSDLYALGATAYYLLTGSQAYAARDLEQLPELWRVPIPSVSARVAALGRTDLEAIPAGLDALIAALLSPQALARPRTTEEVIDRLDALVGGSPPATEAVELHLSNAAFVGRARERRALRRMLTLAVHGRGQSCIVEGSLGTGRSRLVREFAVEAQLASAIVLQVDAHRCAGAFGVANALALKLLDALGDAAARAPDVASLALLSPRLRERLGAREAPPTESGVELRLRMQSAVSAWLQRIAEEQLLVVLVAGLEAADEESLSALISLVQSRGVLRLLFVGTARPELSEARSAVERALAKHSRRLLLAPLRESETYELLRSVFGDVEHLGRLAHRLHQVTRGNPEHTLELCSQLVRRDVIGFVRGAWVLPPEVPEAYLASSREQALTARLSFLSAGAEALGRILSVHHHALSIELARALSDSVDGALFGHLGELLREGIVVRESEGIRFAHETLRIALRSALEPAHLRTLLRTLGHALMQAADVGLVDRVRSGVYALESGEHKGTEGFARACIELTLEQYDKLRHVLPELESALAIFRAERRPASELIPVLAPLAIAGYYVDWRYGVRYGEESVALLQDFVGLTHARKLRRVFGRKLGLLLGLGFAALRHGLRRNPRAPTLRQSLLLLFNCVATLSGTATICVDPKRAHRYADVIEPLTALGPRHVASFVHEFCCRLADTMRDTFGRTLAGWRRVVERLESGEPIEGMPEGLRRRYLAGALYAMGAIETLRDNDKSLRTADRLDALGLLHCKLNAAQIRAHYHANQGNLALHERYRELAEQHAIVMGTSWQAEIWGPFRMLTAYIPMHDAMGLKRVIAQLERWSQDIPTLAPSVVRGRGTQLVLLGQYREALPLLASSLPTGPDEQPGWGTFHGILAMAHNELGEHARAYEDCMRALAYLDPEELTFPAVNLGVQLELEVARAGLGEIDLARRSLDELLALHSPNKGPLTVGRLHEAGVRIELIAGDYAAARRHFEQLEHWYLQTGVPALAQHCDALERRIADPATADARAQLLIAEVDAGHVMAERISRLFATASPREATLRAVLRALAEESRSARGFLFVHRGRLQQRASLEDEPAPSPGVMRWLRDRIAAERVLDEGSTQMLQSSPIDRNVLVLDGWHYRTHLLVSSTQAESAVCGAVVLGARERAPAPCPPPALRIIAEHIDSRSA